LEYKVNEIINSPWQEYLDSCLSLTDFQDNIYYGDKFLKLRDNKLQEFEFISFIYCQWKEKNGGKICSICSICNGKVKAKNHPMGLCSGAGDKQSNIYKIVKKVELLEDGLFEI